MDIKRRPANDSDKAYARETHHLAYRDVIERQFGSWDKAQQDALFEKDWAATPHEIIEEDGYPCGFLSIEDQDDAVFVRHLVVHPAHQGKGLGTTILRDAIHRAETRGVPVKIETLHKNKAMVLYKRLGFKIYDENETHTQMKWER